MALFIVGFLFYIFIGGCLCFLYKYIASEFDDTKSEYDMGTDSVVAIMTGAFWPAVAAFSFGILFAKRRRERKRG